MSVDDLSAFQLLKPGLRVYLAAYTPTFLTADQWAQVRTDVVDLVSRCEPGSEDEVKIIASCLCRFLGELREEVDELDLQALLTTLNVARVLDRYEAQGMKRSSRAQHQTQFNRCLRVVAGLPVRLPRRVGKSRTLDQYSIWEFQRIVVALGDAPERIRIVGLGALVLGIGHGMVVPESESISVAAEGDISWAREFLSLDPDLWDALQEVVLNGFSSKEWDSVRKWLVRHRPAAPHLRADRLRDSWFAGPMQDPATTKPATQLMADRRVGRCLIESLLALLCPVSIDASGILLRDF